MSKPDIPKPTLELFQKVIRPLRFYFHPALFGLDVVSSDKPALYVCNHTIFGLTDGVFLCAAAYEEKDVLIHVLVDDMHTKVPIWRDIAKDLGMVPASREACAQLMQDAEHIMVFPGGAREVCKQKGEAYQLVWKDHVGFAHMAIQFGYDIIPVASVGAEEAFEILYDSKDIMNSPFGKFLKLTGIADKYLKGGEIIPPIVKGIGKTGLPRPERIFIKLGERIETKSLMGLEDDQETLFALRDKVEASLENMIEELKEIKANDQDEEWWSKWLKSF